MPDKTGEYVNLVCEQIRWKKARFRVSEEMIGHIVDGKNAYVAQGLDEDAATEKAIADTGDAVAIGARLDRIHRPKPQWGLLAATFALLLLGLSIRLFVFNDGIGIGSMSFRLLCTGVGIAGLLVSYFVDFTLLGKYPKAIYFGTIALAIAVLISSPTVNGRSLYAQYLILLFPLAFAAIIFAMRSKGVQGILLCGLAFALLGVIALYIPNISGSLLFVVAGMALMGAAICKNWFGIKKTHGFIFLLLPIILLAIVFWVNMDGYRWNRLAVAFNPSLDPYGSGYMGVLTRDILNGAEWFGQGIVPEGHFVSITQPGPAFYSDLMLTSLTSLWGWVAFLVIVAVFLFFIIKGFISCFRQKSSLGFFVSFAIMLTLSFQVISYVLYNLGFQFAAPISLPLVSHGNMALMVNLVLIGLLLSVFRTGDVASDGKIPPIPIQNKFISWDNGKLTITFKAQ